MNETIDEVMTLETIEPTTHKAPAVRQDYAVTAPSDLLRMAVEQGADLDRLERLMALQERWEAGEAKKKFAVAFAAFKAEAVKIIKNKLITDGPLKNKKHAELSDAVNAATPALSRHGLSTAWRLTKDDKDWLEVTCTLSHEGGHSESVSMGGPPDTGPGRNAMQARGSSKTYLERYTLTAILGLAAQDADDDGAGGKGEGDDELLATWVERANAAINADSLAKTWSMGVAEFNTAKDKAGYKAFKAVVAAKGEALKGATA